MSTIKSSAENLTLNADGANNDIKFQSNGSEVASIDQAGLVTASGVSLTAGGTLTTASGNDLNIVYPDARSLFIKEAGTTHIAINNAGVMSVPSGIELGSGVDGTAANTLSDYEEGTFTAATSGITYTKNTGYYRKVGSLVYIELWVSVNNYSSGSRVQINGLPFTSINISSGDGHFPISATRFSGLHTAVTALYPMVINNSTGIKCDALTGTANAGITTNVEIFASGAAIYFGGCYIAV